jgi:hypothetical protein
MPWLKPGGDGMLTDIGIMIRAYGAAVQQLVEAQKEFESSTERARTTLEADQLQAEIDSGRAQLQMLPASKGRSDLLKKSDGLEAELRAQRKKYGI